MVTFHTNHGDIVIKTFDDKAPETVKNFLDYCREGFYNNTIFHRVINGFMIQGGGFEPGMKQKATKRGDQKRSQQWSEKYPWYAGNGTYSGRHIRLPRNSSSTWQTTTS
ncbi:peptidyl-prolyl cis-trans isomerase B [Salmonella enterica subsp. enterica serovar Daytona]|uniref:Peptidyl-prolyl cis-trans isomerase n=1 Tax=Salmonella enterica subsp. enterica serovar Daytona TaxID=1962639 RepID=A0A447JLX1_SALET|nr:peptidyl-prolyl cis-trans isomerase B [Salmonella enterica subsp. enterica serovar Daytona]